MGRIAAAGALGTVIAVVMVGCGGHKAAQRDSVNGYFNDVNNVQRAMVVEISRVNIAYRGFRIGKGTPAVRELQNAERTIRLLRTRLGRLDPPALAVPIHRDLLRLFAQEALVAHELTAMVQFLPRFQRTTASAAAADKELRAGLGQATKPVAEAAVLERYAAHCRAALASLHGLAPPDVLRPLYDSRIAHLKAGNSLATRLAAALRHGDRLRVPGLSMRLQALEAGAEEVNGANAEAVAVRGYSSRLESISRLQARIERKRATLQTRLG